MKNIYIFLIVLIFQVQAVSAQKVDNIKIEKSGNLINIRYQIPKSTSSQVFRVTVLCSINGGVDEVLRSVSGDTGAYVEGGKSEYSVYWDVLKDKDEVKSAEFVVRVELISDNIVKPANTVTQKKVNETGFDKKRFNALASIGIQGPKYGAMLGYLGSWGVYLNVVNGPTTKSSDADVNANPLTIPSFVTISSAITKRIINKNAVQLHLALGIANSECVFYEKINTTYSYSYESLVGPEFGIVLGVKGGSAMLTVSKLSPSSIEEGTNLRYWSTLTLVTFGFGVRF